MLTSTKNNRTQVRKRDSKGLTITCEILPPGTLKRNNSSMSRQHCAERWEEIIEICADTIAEASQNVE